MQTKVLVMDGKSVKEKLRSLGVNLAELATKLGYDNDQRLHSQLKAADVKSGLLEDVARAIGCDVSLFYGGSSIPGSNDANAGGGTAVAGVGNNVNNSDALLRAFDELAAQRRLTEKAQAQVDELLSLVKVLSNK